VLAGAAIMAAVLASVATLVAEEPSPDGEGGEIPASSGLEILLVVGTGGEAEYERFFGQVAALWKDAARAGGATFRSIGWEPGEVETAPSGEPDPSDPPQTPTAVDPSPVDSSPSDTSPSDTSPSDREQLEAALRSIEAPEFWLVLVGHGTYDGREVKFNLRGPDLTDVELAEWLEGYEGSLSVINAASASGSFIRNLSAPGRVVVTATKHEAEVSFTRFGRYFAEAIGGLPEADLDNDEQVSLLEAFLHASRESARFYESEGRLATEHALLDDNGDGMGSRAEWFEGTTATREVASEAGIDGDLARQRVLVGNAFERRLDPEQRARRDALEQEVRQLRRRRDEMPEEEYYPEMEALLLELSRLYHEVGDT